MTALVERLRATPALHLADQVLSSGTNFLAVVFVARNGTPQQFGVFSIFLVVYYIVAGFNRSVPHAIAMTMAWDDERARSGYFFLPPLAVGLPVTIALGATYAFVDPSWLFLPVLLVPLLLQDAMRMHAFATQRPQVALGSDAVWLVIAGVGFLAASSSTSAAAAWAVGGLCALLVTRPWRIRWRVQRRPIRSAAINATVEYATLYGLGYLTPLLATPIITVVGVGALQGSNVIRGPIILLVQGLLVHRMSGPPIRPSAGMREALRLSGITMTVTLLCIPPLFLLRDLYGPRLLGATWPAVQPLVSPMLLATVLGAAAFGPATVARKMGRFGLSAKVQAGLAPVLVGLPLAGAVVGGTEGYLYALAGGYALLATVWWIVLSQVTRPPVAVAVAVSDDCTAQTPV